jgi:hypothetical protein
MKLKDRVKAFYQGIQDMIDRDGFAVMGIFSHEDDLPFMYTIGNCQRGFPELLLIGVFHGDAINDLVHKMWERGKPFDNGELVSLGGDWPVKVIDADAAKARKKYTIQVDRYYRNEKLDYRVQQIIIPDEAGRYPGDPDAQPPYSTIPVLRPPLH